MASVSDDATAKWMKDNGLELTRENYIAVNWGNTPPDPWTFEDEAQLPDELQDPSKVVLDDEAEPREE